MRKIIPLIIFLLFARPLFAQTVNIDSLIRVALTDTTKGYFYTNKDSLFNRLPFAKSSAARVKLVYEIIDYGDDVSAQGLSYHYKILKWAVQHNDQVIQAVVTAEIGYNVASNGDETRGVKICFDALSLAESTKNNQAIAIAYDNLATSYSDNNSNASKLYSRKSLHFSMLANDDLFTAYSLFNLGTIYFRLNNADSAKYYLSKALEWTINKHIRAQTATCIVAFAKQTNAHDQLKLYKAAEKIATRNGDNEGITSALINIGRYYQKFRELDSALFYGRKAYNIAQGFSLNFQLAPARFLAQSFNKNQPDSILKYTLRYYQIRDSLQNITKIEQAQSIAFTDEQNRIQLKIEQEKYQANLRFYVLGVIFIFLLLVSFIFWRNNQKQKRTNQLLSEQKEEIETQRDNLEEALQELKTTQTQLVQREKMASLGELTAGIAHEIQNPLNFVNNFSDVNREMLEELKAESEKPKAERDNQLEAELISDLIENEKKINNHGKRADAIVKGMLQHSQVSSGQKEPTDINALADEYLRLAYHGLRAKDKDFNAELITHFGRKLPKVEAVPQDIGRVMLNLFNNAFYAVQQKAKTAGAGYKPEIEVSTMQQNGSVIVTVKDNGNGIPDAIKDKIMQPFFTTKPTGEGTGLGLSLSYDIVVKGHGGKINAESKEGEGSEFIIKLPLPKLQ